MLSKSELNNSPRSTHTEPEESTAKRDASRDDMPSNSIKNGISTLIHLVHEILIFSHFLFLIMI